MAAAATADGPLLAVERLRVEFPTRRGTLTAVHDVSFDIAPGEVLGVVCVEVIHQARRRRHHLTRPGVVAVEGAQRVGVDAPLNVAGELVLVHAQVGLQQLAVLGA